MLSLIGGILILFFLCSYGLYRMLNKELGLTLKVIAVILIVGTLLVLGTDLIMKGWNSVQAQKHQQQIEKVK